MINNAKRIMESFEYKNGGKRQGDHLLEISGSCGLFIDEIAVINGKSFYFYHGNPIAMFDGEWHYSDAGWKTKTTKDRLNALGCRIGQKKGEWYNRGLEFVSERKVIQDNLGLELYHRIEGWRGYYTPAFSVLIIANTGDWSDSPCPRHMAEDAIKSDIATLRGAGFRAYLATVTTSNIFCVHHHIIVRACDYARAVSWIKGHEHLLKCDITRG
jgi:hypothetical protein